MADKIILDFENNIITWDTDVQKGTEYYPDLEKRKEAILSAMGYESVNFSSIKSINAFMNGEISKEELINKFDEFTKQ